MLHLLVLDKGTFTAEGPVARFATQEILLRSFSSISILFVFPHVRRSRHHFGLGWNFCSHLCLLGNSFGRHMLDASMLFHRRLKTEGLVTKGATEALSLRRFPILLISGRCSSRNLGLLSGLVLVGCAATTQAARAQPWQYQ
jgi:hypothetical protein